MSGAWLAHPDWLGPLAAAWSALALLTVAAFLRARRRAALLLGPGGRRRVGATRFAADLALVAALALVAVALAGPRAGTRVVRVPASGVDVALLVDVSRSMDAADVAPSRLARARRAARRVLERLGDDDRAALVGFAGRGVVFAPLTPDLPALAEMVAALDSELIRPGGSRLGGGVETAVSVFEAGSERPRAVLVLSDGEQLGDDVSGAVLAVRRTGARVVAAALGTEEGATLPDHGVPLRDDRGDVVVSRRRLAALERLVEASDGALFVADRRGRFDLDAAVAALRRDAGAKGAQGPVERRVSAVRVAPFAAGAFLLLWLEAVAGGARRPRRVRLGAATRRAAAGVAIALVALAAHDGLRIDEAGDDGAAAARELARLEREARSRPLAPPELVRLGVARATLGHDAAARDALRTAALSAPDPRVAALACHDLGVLALRRGDVEAARGWFFDALALDPERGESRFNLEWTLRTADEDGGGREPAPPTPSEPEDEPADEDEPSRTPPPPSPPGAAASESAPGDAAPAPSAAAPELDAQERARWLERVEDDLERSLAATARETDPRSRERREPRRELPRW